MCAIEEGWNVRWAKDWMCLWGIHFFLHSKHKHILSETDSAACHLSESAFLPLNLWLSFCKIFLQDLHASLFIIWMKQSNKDQPSPTHPPHFPARQTDNSLECSHTMSTGGLLLHENVYGAQRRQEQNICINRWHQPLVPVYTVLFIPLSVHL